MKTLENNKNFQDKSIGEMYSDIKLKRDVVDKVSSDKKSKETFDIAYNMGDSEEESTNKLNDAYKNIMELLKEYCDLDENYYNIIALWIIGTYFHQKFPSYAYLYFNAMRGSGKSRTMNLVTTLSHGGQMLNSPTEAVLFRTGGTLGIDEFEGMERKGGEALRELLNSGYKKGTSVHRMRKKRTADGEKMVVEKFDVYRPIVMANIAGIENVLHDRCIPIILEKSEKGEIINLVEIFHSDSRTLLTKEILNSFVKKSGFSVVSVNVVSPENMYKEWNNYVKSSNVNYTNNTNHIYNTNNTNYTHLFKSIKFSGIGGRDLELCLPLLIMANLFGGEILKETTLTLKKIMDEKREDSFTENKDIMLIDYVSQLLDESSFKRINKIVQEFKEFTQMNEDWVNNKWMGRALKRLSLIKEKRRQSNGFEVILNVPKAQQKIKVFKE